MQTKRVKTKRRLGQTSIYTPPIIFGTSCLGNLYESISYDTKLSIISEWFEWVESPVVIDTAGKYGAGLALEMIGKGLVDLQIDEDKILISNKLGWIRTDLKGPEPSFEPGVWADLENDAIQKISYRGILECYEQGLELMGGKYKSEIVSVHDPDEYLAAASSPADREKRFEDIIQAYQALGELKSKGQVKAVGVGAKDWTVIRELTGRIQMDWVMFSVSFTIMNQPPELLKFIEDLTRAGTGVINSAVFHSGFLTGGAFYDYRKVSPEIEEDKPLFKWRENFYKTCEEFQVKPFEACVAFGMSPPGVVSIAMNTSKPSRIKDNAMSVIAEIPNEFWKAMKSANLISSNYKYL